MYKSVNNINEGRIEFGHKVLKKLHAMSSSISTLIYKMNNQYIYTIKHLVSAFHKEGLMISKMWIYRQEEKGNLILPRSTTDFKKSQGARRKGAVRIFTSQQIKDIIQAFLPGGPGYYNYKEKVEGLSNKT